MFAGNIVLGGGVARVLSAAIALSGPSRGGGGEYWDYVARNRTVHSLH